MLKFVFENLFLEREISDFSSPESEPSDDKYSELLNEKEIRISF